MRLQPWHICRAVLLLLFLGLVAACGEDAPMQPPAGDNIDAFTAEMTAVGGFVPLFVDADAGRVYLSLDRFNSPFIYQHSLPRGVGSNDLGLDRGKLSSTLPALVQFEAAGDKVLLRQLNTRYRAESDSKSERRAVEEAFASSVLWGFPVVARDAGVLLVDATDFVLRDATGVVRTLVAREHSAAAQSDFKLDSSRSALEVQQLKAFPRNTELQGTLTFIGDKPGVYLRQVAPNPYSFSVSVRHSFVALPEPGYLPRRFDPESGFMPFSYADYAQAIDAPLVQRLIPRHRLQKRNPRAKLSKPVEPIIYYLDPGTPEPVRSALLEGASWWNQAFEAAGYRDAFQVEMLPEGADPMDVRYNIIQWVHRATRGWSYGYGVTDPRTGEIIKGHVTLGSLRVRQDILIAQGLTSPFTEKGDSAAVTDMALARLRQLSAHEVGHTLGLAHNFVASTRGRESVMDYPHPQVSLSGSGDISLVDAYATGIGEWDKRAILYGYGEFGSAEKESAGLASVLQDNQTQGFGFITDPDSRSLADMHARSSLWDNGADAAAELRRVMAVRAAALDNFGAGSLPPGQPYSELREVLVPLYFFHRYQVEATGKSLGGSDYRYASRQPGEAYWHSPVAAASQREALAALLDTLDASFLTLDAQLLTLVPPRAYGYSDSRESPRGYTGAQLDAVSLAEASVRHTLDVLLHPQRLARLNQQHAVDATQPGAAELLQQLGDTVLAPRPKGLAGMVQRRSVAVLLAHWQALLVNPEIAPELRAQMLEAMLGSRRWLRDMDRAGSEWETLAQWQLHGINRLLEDPAVMRDGSGKLMPPGSPI